MLNRKNYKNIYLENNIHDDLDYFSNKVELTNDEMTYYENEFNTKKLELIKYSEFKYFLSELKSEIRKYLNLSKELWEVKTSEKKQIIENSKICPKDIGKLLEIIGTNKSLMKKVKHHSNLNLNIRISNIIRKEITLENNIDSIAFLKRQLKNDGYFFESQIKKIFKM